MSKYIDSVVESWKEVLGEGNAITNKKVRRATALMLENQLKYNTGKTGQVNESGVAGVLGATGGYSPSNGGADYNTNGEFHKIAIPMVRRTFPELIAHEIVGVQPMTGPVGLAFALRFKAGQEYAGLAGGTGELGYNNLDPYYSGPQGVATAEALGSQQGASVANAAGTDAVITQRGLGIGTGEQIKELTMTVEKAQVEATTRKLRSRWSLEVAQDLKAMHGLDLEEEMMDILAYEITAEIDRELVNKIRSISRKYTWNYSTSDGRWESEKYRNFYNMVIRKSNQIAVLTRRGAGNFVISAPSLCAALETSASFAIHPVNNDVNTAVTGVAKLGSLDGRMTVYRDTFAMYDDVVIGYKGPSEYDTGIVYLPYIQLLVSRAIYEDSFNPTVGLMSRYAIYDNIFGAENYYSTITVQNLPA